jgi:hypothetical protein
MTLDDFRQSLTAAEPPAGLAHALAGLWWAAKGDWTRAHESAQQDQGSESSWVHAYLHRNTMRATPCTGTVKQASLLAGSQWTPNEWLGIAGDPLSEIGLVDGSDHGDSGIRASMRSSKMKSITQNAICAS